MTGRNACQALIAKLDAALAISPAKCFDAPLTGSLASPPTCAWLYEQAGHFTGKCIIKQALHYLRKLECNLFHGEKWVAGFFGICLENARRNDQAAQNEALAFDDVPVSCLN